MRYYGEDYKQHIIKSINNVRDSVDVTDYAQIIRNVDVSAKNTGLKTECVNAGGNAYSQVSAFKGKLQHLITILRTFYNGADETSTAVWESARKIREIIKETNEALVRMNNAVNGIGVYKGTKVTSDVLKGAGLDEQKCAELKADIWDKLFTIQFKNGDISYDEAVSFVDYINNLQKSGLPVPDSAMKNADAAFGVYIDKMKSLDPDKIPAKDMERINAIYNYYCIYHLGPENKIEDLKVRALQNCITAYEIINPDAKKITDKFFEDAYTMYNDAVDYNILRIKYTLYTSDPEERDLMLYYLDNDKVKLNVIESGVTPSCTYSDPPILNIDLRGGEINRCCAFFHELGHAIDCLSGFPSDKYMDDLVKDFKNHMHNALAEMGVNLKPDQEQEVIDYFFTCEGPNVINSKGIDSPYPSNWTTSQAMAYYKLKDYYGYVEYNYNPWEYASDNNRAYKKFTDKGYTNGVLYGSEEDLEDKKTSTTGNSTADYYMNQGQNKPDEKQKPWHNDYGIVSDVGGGLTNNQIGCTCSGHGATITNNAGIIRSASDLRRQLKYYDYFYGDQNTKNNTDLDRTLKTSAAHEFFAENWEYEVMGFDRGPTRETFPTACQDFDNTKKAMIENTKY